MTTPHLHSYSSILALDSRIGLSVFDGPVVVQEKVDGSQFSFGVTLEGDLMARSKGQHLNLSTPPKMFGRAIEVVRKLAPLLTPGWTYRGEYLNSPRHNKLAYSRVPQDNIILYDIDRGTQEYLPPDEMLAEAARIGLETVPILFVGVLEGGADAARKLLPEESVLGGVVPEGVVVKNYAKLNPDKKTLMVKFVTDAFREVMTGKKPKEPRADIVNTLVAQYKTEARWEKAVQHLREDDKLTGTPKDIGPLVKEVAADILKEEEEAIKQALFAHFWPAISKGAIDGLPQWYKARLEEDAARQD